MHINYNALPRHCIYTYNVFISSVINKNVYSSCLFLAYNVTVGAKVKVSELWIKSILDILVNKLWIKSPELILSQVQYIKRLQTDRRTLYVTPAPKHYLYALVDAEGYNNVYNSLYFGSTPSWSRRSINTA